MFAVVSNTWFYTYTLGFVQFADVPDGLGGSGRVVQIMSDRPGKSSTS